MDDDNKNQPQGGLDQTMEPNDKPNADKSRSSDGPGSTDPYARVISSSAGAPRKSKKKLVLFGIIVLVLLLVAGGVVFGYYLPNKPENMWNASLNRTGEALESVTVSATEKNKLESFEKSQVSGSAELLGKDGNYTANFRTIFDKSKTDGSVDVVSKTEGQPDRTFGAKFLGELKEGSTYPTIHFQLSGFTVLGLDQFEPMLPGITEYDGKWISIDEAYLKSVAEQMMQAGQTPAEPQTQAKKEETVTSEDIAAFARTISQTVREYVLTADPNKAVLERRSFVGKETIGDVKTHHYKAGIHKAHAKELCKIMNERVFETQVYKKLIGAAYSEQQQRDDAKKKSIEDCQKSVDNLKQERTFDIWIDSKYKLVHKIRINNEKKPANYVEFGQNYKGGDQLSLFVHTYDAEAVANGTFTVDVHLKSNETKANLSYKSTKEDKPFSIKASLEAKPFKKEIKIEQPAGSVPIKDIFDRYGVDPSALLMLGAGLQGSAQTEEGQATGTESTTDLPAMYSN